MVDKTYTEEQMSDIKGRIDKAQEQIKDILKESELVITSEPAYIKLETGIFATTFRIGYLDTKFSEKKEEVEIKEEGPVIEE